MAPSQDEAIELDLEVSPRGTSDRPLLAVVLRLFSPGLSVDNRGFDSLR